MAEICLECWRDRPFLDRTYLVFSEVVPMERWKATRPDSDEDCSLCGDFPATVIMPSAWPDWSKFQLLRLWHDPAEIRTTAYRTWSEQQSRRHGELWWTYPPQTKLQAPQIEIWNTISQWNFCQIWMSSPPCANVKTPTQSLSLPIDDFLATVLVSATRPHVRQKLWYTPMKRSGDSTHHCRSPTLNGCEHKRTNGCEHKRTNGCEHKRTRRGLENFQDKRKLLKNP